MTISEIGKLLEATGIPVRYGFFKEPQKPPFICYVVAYSNNCFADDAVIQRIDHIQVELYTEKKNEEAEDKVEKALSSFSWNKEENYIDDEKLWQILYEMEVIR